MPEQPALPHMIAVDMDGTLVHPDGYVTSANCKALQLVRDAGARIVIATGRRHSYAMHVLQGANMQPDDIVLSSNGSVARTVAGHLLFRETMPLDTALNLCGSLQQYRDALVLTFDVLTDDGKDCRGALVLENRRVVHRSIQRWVESNDRYIQNVNPIENALRKDHLPIQAMLCGTMERMRAAEAHLAGHHGGMLELFRTEYPARDLCILDIMPRGISKGSGVRRLLEAANVTQDGLIALGDNWNDLPMFEVARWPVVMGNAPEALRTLALQRGWKIAGTHDNDAVAAVLQEAFHPQPVG